MKRLAQINLNTPKLDYVQMATLINEIIERVNYLLPETPVAKFVKHQVVWYEKKNTYATVNHVEVNKYNVVMYKIIYVINGIVCNAEEITEIELNECKPEKPAETVPEVHEVNPRNNDSIRTSLEKPTDIIYHTGRQGQEVTIMLKDSGERHHFMNYVDACKFMGRGASYLSNRKTVDSYSNGKYRWVFGMSKADRDNVEANQKTL